jgi:hypothetical protein
MFDLLWFLGLLFSLWRNIPQPIKDKIIDLVTESFDHIFREFYRNYSRQSTNP